MLLIQYWGWERDEKLLNLSKNELGFILTVLDILAILNVNLKSEELD